MAAQALVTGATGFIGRHVTWQLLAAGHEVRVLARDPEKAQRLFGGHVLVVKGSVTDDAAVGAAVKGVEWICHVAGLYRFGWQHRREMVHVNVEGTRTVLHAAAREASVRRIVHVSSAGVLRRPDGRVMDEEDFPATPPWGCHYKTSKWLGERVALEAAASSGLPVIIASPTCPIGEGDEGPTPSGRMIRDFILGRFPFSAKTGLNFADVTDVAAGIIAAFERGAPGRRYIIGNENVMLGDFLGILGQETGLPAPRYVMPWPVIALAGIGGEIFGMLEGRGRDTRICVETAVQAWRRQFFKMDRATRELGYVPRHTTAQAVRHAVAWYREHAEAVERGAEETGQDASRVERPVMIP